MKKYLLLLTLAVSMASCSPFALKSSGVLNNSDLTAYKSFKMQQIDKDKLPDRVSDTDLIRLYRALGNELAKRGYKYVEGNGDADLTVYVGLSTKQSLETDVNTSGVSAGFAGGYYGPVGGYRGYNYYGPTPYTHGYFGTSSATTEVVTDGVLVVDLVENKDNNHVFYTQISANIDGEHLVLKDNELLAKAAAKAFKKFPLPDKE